MRFISRNDRDGARFKCHRSHALDFDDQLARANIVIADELVGHREEGLEMAGGELGGDAKVSTELPVDDHAPSEAKRAQDIVQNVHR
jgi:hypothetical protein